MDSFFTQSHLHDSAPWWNHARGVKCDVFHARPVCEKHAAGSFHSHDCCRWGCSLAEPCTPRGLRKDQSDLLWERRGPTSPTDITVFFSELPSTLHMRPTQTPTSNGYPCYYLRSSTTMIKMWRCAYCYPPSYMLCCQPLISLAWSNPGFT